MDYNVNQEAQRAQITPLGLEQELHDSLAQAKTKIKK